MALWATSSIGNWADEVERAEQEEEEEKEKEKAHSLSSQHHQYATADNHHSSSSSSSASFMNRVASSKVFHGLQKGFKKLGFRAGKQRSGLGAESMAEGGVLGGVGGSSVGAHRRERDLPQLNLSRSASVGHSPGPSSLHRSNSASRADSVPDWSAAKKAMAAAVAATPTRSNPAPATPAPAPRTAPSNRTADPSGNSGRALSPSPMALSTRDNRTRCHEQNRQAGPQKSRPAKNSPFGEARPREVLLAERGMDWRKLDLELDHRPTVREETEEERKLKEELKGMEQSLNKRLMDHEFKFYKKGNSSRERWAMEREIMGLREGVAAKEKQLHDLATMLDEARFHNQQKQRLMKADGGNGPINNKMGYFDATPAPPASRSVSSTRRALVLEQHPCNERGGGAFPRSRSVDRKWGEVGLNHHHGHELVPVIATPPPPHHQHHHHVQHYQTHHHQFHYEQHHHHHQVNPPPPMWNNYSPDPYPPPPPPHHHYQNQHPPQLLPQSPIQGGHISYLERAAIFGC